MSQPEPAPDRIVEQWLAEVERAAADLPADQRAELVGDLREHISVARGDLSPETGAGVRTILERLGDPAVIAAEARDDLPPPHAGTPPGAPPRAPGRRSRSRTGWIVAAVIAAVVLCLAGCVITGLSMFAARTVSGDLEGVPTPGMIATPSPTPQP
jgi:uncharacterized membrane protein